ncbi:hypothetical protein [Mangrovivirga cuniculi]|uniref:Uncharacterized protein n=1 Tax=Mangrovivirga cuniculi TaxID=2715131 RepID=A0A4D7K730_9BACT|nr:hypothetical protein [Mangrovivirga cuniculi]QCK15188.1 hypothetical protein DCC35_10735 [Mangrovivirga cuniculi]
MTKQEVEDAIKDIPLGSKIQLIKKNGEIVEVRLASHVITSSDKKDYGEVVVPELPPAILVRGGTRFGNFRMETDDLVKIAWIE